MPIYEFKCSKCEEVFELLLLKEDEVGACKKCGSGEFERIMSSTNYAMGAGGGGAKVSAKTRSCSSGSCTTYDIPGPNG